MIMVELINRKNLESKDIFNRIYFTCWLVLPASEDEIMRAMEVIEVERTDEIIISNFKTDIVGLKIDPKYPIEELNEDARRFENLADFDQIAVRTIIETTGCTLRQALDKVENGEFEF